MKEITKKNMLDWLEDARLSAAARLAALGDGEEERVQDGPEAREVCIINAIAERVNGMTAVEYLKTQREMFVQKASDAITATLEQAMNPRHAVEIVKRWKEEQDGISD